MCFTRARRQLVISWSERIDTPPSRSDDDGGHREQQLKRSRFVKNLPTEIVSPSEVKPIVIVIIAPVVPLYTHTKVRTIPVLYFIYT